MKANDIMTIATTALGTATLTVVAFLAGPTDAGNDAEAPSPKLSQARFVSRGVEMALASVGNRTFKAGEQPEIELTAYNTTDQSARTTATVTMTAAAPADRFSRVIRMPLVLWQCDQVVELQAKEKKLFTLRTQTNLPPGSVVNVTLREAGPLGEPAVPGITALSFSTVLPKAAPVLTVNL